MKRVLGIAVSLYLASFAFAQDAPKAEAKKPEAPAAAKGDDKEVREILKKCDAATKAAKAVKYNASYKGTGALESRAPQVSGTVVLVGKVADVSGFFARYRVEAKVKPPGGADEETVIIGSDADKYFLVDNKNKMVHEDIDPSVIGRKGNAALTLAMREFAHPTPFSDEINSDVAELKGKVKIGDQECYEIYIKYAGGQGEAIWCFSTKDHLPRRVDRMVVTQTGEKGAQQLTITDLQLDPKSADEDFKAKVPDGFKKTDEPAQ